MDKSIIQAVMGEAAKSNVEKRQVGCVITLDGEIVAKGHNTVYNLDGQDKHQHAEVAALSEYFNLGRVEYNEAVAYVSHQPCPDCALRLAGIKGLRIEVIEAFKKFDGDKLRYDLIPTSSTLALASVLTMGARKYAPNNWRKCEDLDRYVAAAMRHFEAYRAGEWLDTESTMPHLWHVMTNLAFLIELEPNSAGQTAPELSEK